jgi:two-component sensor histidine kinase
MNIEINIRELLSLMDRPAFCVAGSLVTEVNAAAQNLGVQAGLPIAKLLCGDCTEYETYSDGLLYLTLKLPECSPCARVSKLGGQDLFTIEPEEDDHLQALSLAAQELRLPLSQVMGVYELMMPKLEQAASEKEALQLCRMNRSLYQLLRLVGNMSDARSSGIAKMELQELTALLEEIMEHAQDLCQDAGITVVFENHPSQIFSIVDIQKLERAVYNLLSNAMRHTPAGGVIHVRFARRNNSAVLTVSDPGNGAPADLSPEALRKYQREPSLFDRQDGLGLGMALIRGAAAAHRGTLLLRPRSEGGMQAVFSFPICQDTTQLRSPSLRIDYAGERDHGLVELSQFLPPERFSSK